jgi:Gpi18-like mannosyltransferase
VSIFFEYLLAFGVGRIIYIKYKDPVYIWLSLAIIPWIPTIMANSALWGQCDSIYTTFVVASIYFAIMDKKFASCLFLGIAISFKLQAVFILPFFFVLLLRKKINWYYFLLIPLTYFISVLPAWFYGRSLTDLFSIYLNQANNYEALTLYLPNIYVWISNDLYVPVKIAGIIVTFLVVMITGIWLSNKKLNFTLDHWIDLAFLSVIITPFLLPGMHERYLYLGDVLAFMYFFVLRRNILYSVGIMSISFYAYLCCSRLKTILPVWPAFFIYLLIIILVIKEFRGSFVIKSNQHET